MRSRDLIFSGSNEIGGPLGVFGKGIQRNDEQAQSDQWLHQFSGLLLMGNSQRKIMPPQRFAFCSTAVAIACATASSDSRNPRTTPASSTAGPFWLVFHF